ncbi:uncharacterized protein B0I36DRAFT_252528 [Microdochium trichocladiopsis]|uniref:Rhodopsin domain-containing protein n=1 Tax=Microdochium trichocladiopsis TaxID=1682393 RepID=A0A9P8XW07_9PEZI|nr:uncharacterized protein B0I36DRAFT_252528 [Microdochium trichocladiopsis]KAH7021215.1 hypothetical protein B0I36DRAFT_252528 [Microdochium trichocladiopsis]
MEAYIFARADDDDDVVHDFVSPWVELNIGLWALFAATTIFLASRIWIKVTRRYGLWYDDYILVVSWIVLVVTDSLIVHQFATGYILENSAQKWDDRMHILINVTSCGTLIGQSLTKTAFAVTLLRLSKTWQRHLLWFCIVTMNSYMVVKVILQWAKVCGSKSTDVYYRFDLCLDKNFRDDFKAGGNIYNIVMDFVFATFPWFLIRGVDMRRFEKIGLCAVMSLGMLVAVVSAIRVSWKDEGNERDTLYIYRNGISQVWYSSEVTGTIIVQCIPILRPVLRDVHNTLTSKKMSSTGDRRSTTTLRSDLQNKGVDSIILTEIEEEGEEQQLQQKQEQQQNREDQDPWMATTQRGATQIRSPSISRLDLEAAFSTIHDNASLSSDEGWPLPKNQLCRPASIATSESDMSFVEFVDWDNEAYDLGVRKSLSPVPRERTP